MKNCNKQNEKIELVDEKTLVIGVDIGSYDEYARAFTCYRKLLNRLIYYKPIS